ncbi:MAG TPA: hypothetical protein VFL62_22150 [Bradyrhizobium sp.]|uniref:hypothetical protein n=1 Tax=Bradyrhizobium sp. TaxID=376 RepID=UPI002D7F9392|nr:hypothetical protein [Bradyrhizobium sp.]HET7888938.1 hypothetical protein [Bradyrhizobium sp.]
MKNLVILCVLACAAFAGPAAVAGGGMSSHGGMSMGLHPASSALTGIPVTGGAFGERPSSPGTNSLGTALSTSGIGRRQKGPLLGTSPAVDREEARVEKMMTSVCRGC